MSIDLNAPEVQDAIKAAVADAIKTATEPLAIKNKELLGELKEARKGQQIDPAVVERLEAQIDTLKHDLTTANSAVKTANANAEKATKQLESETSFTQNLLVDNGLSDALVKAGVSNPAHLKAVKSMLASQVQIVTEGDQRVAKIGDKALGDAITEWAKSDEGKNFVAATNNNGGGAQGGHGSGGGKTIKQSEFNSLSPKDRALKMSEGFTINE